MDRLGLPNLHMGLEGSGPHVCDPFSELSLPLLFSLKKKRLLIQFGSSRPLANTPQYLVLRSTRAADARGASGPRTLFRLHFHLLFFLSCVLFLTFFYSEILRQNIFFKFCISESFDGIFWLLNFCLQKNFAPQLFFSKFINLKIF